MIRAKLNGGSDILLQTSLNKGIRAWHYHMQTNRLMKVQTSKGMVAVNPNQIVYLKEEETKP